MSSSNTVTSQRGLLSNLTPFVMGLICVISGGDHWRGLVVVEMMCGKK